jgi:hypothetical protein
VVTTFDDAPGTTSLSCRWCGRPDFGRMITYVVVERDDAGRVVEASP